MTYVRFDKMKLHLLILTSLLSQNFALKKDQKYFDKQKRSLNKNFHPEENDENYYVNVEILPQYLEKRSYDFFDFENFQKNSDEKSKRKENIENNLKKLSNEKKLNKEIAKSIKPIPKQWSRWGHWSECSASCGVGEKTRWRFCISDNCNEGEKEAQIKICRQKPCQTKTDDDD